MISEESFRLVSYLLCLGSWTKCLPYKWNHATYTVEVISHLNIWRVYAVGVIIWQLTFTMLNGIPLLMSASDQATVSDFIQFAFVLLCTAFGTFIHFHAILIPHDSAAVFSQIHFFSRKLGKYYFAVFCV